MPLHRSPFCVLLCNKLQEMSFYHYMIRRLSFFLLSIAALFTACSDNDSFSANPSAQLTFSVDTLQLDTLFSTIPSSTYTFWVYNRTGDGLRINNVRLERGNQSGFRANVDGTFLDPVATSLEVRKGDSLRVFVEVTPRETNAIDPQLIEDQLVFTLESGVIQRVNLRAYSWDAVTLNNLVVANDTTIESTRPVVVYGKGITVEEGRTLTIRNTSLYFHDGAGISVAGTLIAENSILRGDRLDHMFDYLPYDRISGQWDGIHLLPTSKNNQLTQCELRNAMTAVACDSTDLQMRQCIVHNSKGHGVIATDATVVIDQCMLTNALGDCLALHGGTATVSHCTLAQFYPFSADRGVALRFTYGKQPLMIDCSTTLVTGYANDVLMREADDKQPAVDFHFADCILRTDSVNDPQVLERIIWETPKDSVQGKQHFRVFDEDNLYYDFRLDSISPAFQKGIGCIY